MVGVFSRASAAFGFAFVTACAAHHAETPPPAATVKAPVAPAPVYRFVSLGVTTFEHHALDDGRIGMITMGAPGRMIASADGSVELPPDTTNRLMGGVPVPARLGGGFLFWEDALYYARSFGVPLEPVVDVPTNALGIEFGPDYLLLFLEEQRPRAFRLDPPRPVQLLPKGVIEVAARDDGRAVARDATGRALFSTDAGKSWKDVSSVFGSRVGGVRESGNEIGFVTGHGKSAWLQADGQFATREFKEAPPATPPHWLTGDRLRRAVGLGLALPAMRALVGEGAGTTSVDLLTGEATPVKVAGPEGSNCMPVSLDDEGVIVCTLYAKQTTSVISHALGAKPVVEKTFQGMPQFLTGPTLNVMASCSGTPMANMACVRRAGGVWAELRIAEEISKAWHPLFWVPRESGGVSAVMFESNQSSEPKLGLLDPSGNRVTPWVAEAGQTVPMLSPYEARLIVRADGSVHGYTGNGTISVDPNGYVTQEKHMFTAITSAGPHALARDVVEHLWQTNDYGAHWQEVARPPFDASPEVSSGKSNPRPNGRATGITCSSMGCVLEHPAGTGFWLRLGWPEDPPKAPEPNATTPNGSPARAIVAGPAMPKPALPKLHCVTRSGGPLRVKTLPSAPPSAQFVEPFDPQGRVQRFIVPKSPSPSDRFDRFDRFDRYSESFQRAVLSTEVGHAGGVLWRGGSETLTLFISNTGQALPIHPECPASGGYVDARGKRFLGCDEENAAGFVEDLAAPKQPLFRAPAAMFFRESAPGMRFFAPGESLFANPDPIAVGRDGKPSILRLPPGDEPPTSDNPAWILSKDAAPVELAPWSTLELATSPACAGNDGYRAIVQNVVKPWFEISGGSELRNASMTALVRWNSERVCLEAVELGFTSLAREGASPNAVAPTAPMSVRSSMLRAAPRAALAPLLVSAVARFAGAQPGAAFVGTEGTARVREPANCELEAHPQQP